MPRTITLKRMILWQMITTQYRQLLLHYTTQSVK